MPKQPQAKESSQPSRGFLSRMFGSDPFTPEMQQGIDIARKEMPDMGKVEPYGFFSRLLQPKALGYTSLGDNIYMNPKTNVGQSPQEIADTLTHEQEHVKQNRASSYGSIMKSMFSPENLPYGQRPNEMAAFQAEKKRRARMGRMQTSVPSFTNPGEFYAPENINLPNPGATRQKQNIMMPKTMY